MKIFHIVAASANNVIGRNGDLPWRIPLDLKRFKRITLNHPIIMGRKTFDSFKSPLPDREHIVISRKKPLKIQNSVHWVSSIEEALILCEKNKGSWGSEIFIIGGGEIYRQSLGIAHEILLTRIHRDIDGDTFYPEILENEFRLIEREDHFDQEPPFSFLHYQAK